MMVDVEQKEKPLIEVRATMFNETYIVHQNLWTKYCNMMNRLIMFLADNPRYTMKSS